MPPDPPVVLGTIFYSSWGYEQTNSEFYQVIAISPSGKTITVQEIEEMTKENFLAGGITAMHGSIMPLPGQFKGQPMRVKFYPRMPYKRGGGSSEPFIKVHGDHYCHIWDGRPVSIS